MPRGRGRGRSGGTARRKCPVHNCFVGADGVCGRCASQVEQQQQVESDQDDQTTSNGNVPNPPDAPNGEETTGVERADVEMCGKCCRISTDFFKLDFPSVQTDSLHTTTFGRPTTEIPDETVKLCQDCARYNVNPHRHKDWPNAWPSVMYTLLFQTHRFSSNTEKLFKILPHEIRTSYMQHLNNVFPAITLNTNESVFRDITREKDNFWTLINTRTAKNLVTALNKYCFPNIRCPAGCFEFIEKTESISFAHFLNYLYPLFTSFDANSKKFLKGAREDLLKPLELLEKFKISPCLIVSEKGLQLVTCSDHKNGVLLKYVHVPTNPVATNISPKFSDRLALMVSSVRTVRPLKIGVKSATFTMCRVDSGRISGVSSTVLHHFRNFEAPYNVRRIDVEKLIFNCRSDVKDLIRTYCQRFEVTENIANEFLSFECPVALTAIEESCKDATVFNMKALMNMKDYVESCPDEISSQDDFKKPLIFGHRLDGYGCEPLQVPKTILQEPNFFSLIFAFLYSPSLWSKLISLSQENEQLRNVCRIFGRIRNNKR